VDITSAMLFALISRLINPFNDALLTVKANAQEQLESSRQLREAQQVAGLGSYALDIASGSWTSSPVCDQVLGIDRTYPRSLDSWRQDITAQKTAQTEVTVANSTLRATLDALPDLMFEVSQDGYIHQFLQCHVAEPAHRRLLERRDLEPSEKRRGLSPVAHHQHGAQWAG
jgi:hypothetical protein